MNIPVVRQWMHVGLACVVYKMDTSDTQHHNGYVGVPLNHPYHGKGYMAVPYFGNHYGFTYSGKLGHAQLKGVGSSKNWWFFGFDTNHHGDASFEAWYLIPPYAWGALTSPHGTSTDDGIIRIMWLDRREECRSGQMHYWTEEEVAAETELIATQLQGYMLRPMESLLSQ